MNVKTAVCERTLSHERVSSCVSHDAAVPSHSQQPLFPQIHPAALQWRVSTVCKMLVMVRHRSGELLVADAQANAGSCQEPCPPRCLVFAGLRPTCVMSAYGLRPACLMPACPSGLRLRRRTLSEVDANNTGVGRCARTCGRVDMRTAPNKTTLAGAQGAGHGGGYGAVSAAIGGGSVGSSGYGVIGGRGRVWTSHPACAWRTRPCRLLPTF